MIRIDTRRAGLGWLAWAVNDYGECGPVRWGLTETHATRRAVRAENARWDESGRADR